MAKMAFQYDIRTTGPDMDIDAMVQTVKENVEALEGGYQMMEKVDIKPLFYGIKSATVQFMVEEGDGVQDRLENVLIDLADKDVTGEWELTFVTRL